MCENSPPGFAALKNCQGSQILRRITHTDRRSRRVASIALGNAGQDFLLGGGLSTRSGAILANAIGWQKLAARQAKMTNKFG
jgi:hypothetical protein